MFCSRRFAVAVSALLISVGMLHAEPWSPRPFLKDEDVETIRRHVLADLAHDRDPEEVGYVRRFRTSKIRGLILALAALDYAGSAPRRQQEVLFGIGLNLLRRGYNQLSVNALKTYPQLGSQPGSRMDLAKILKGSTDSYEPTLHGLVFARSDGGLAVEQELDGLARRPAPWSPALLKDDRLRNMALVTALIAKLTARAKNDRWLPGEDWLAWSKQMRESSVALAAALKKREPDKSRQAALSLHASCVHCHSRETVEISRLDLAAVLRRAHNPGAKGREALLHVIALRADKSTASLRQQAVDVLLGALDDPNATVRHQATVELARFQTAAGRIVPRLVEALRDADPKIRSSASRTLISLGVDAKAVTDVLGAGRLPDPEDYARLWVAYHTDRKNDDPDKTLTILVQEFAKGDAAMRAQMVERLAALPNARQKATATFEQALRDPDADVRQAAAVALMQLHPARSMPVLIAALKDKDPLVSGRAASALAQIGKAAIPALMRALDDPDHEMRRGAAYALGRIGPAAKLASKRLQEMARSQDPLLRLVATRALRRIDPQPLPAVPSH